MNVLIAGGLGYVGSHLAVELLKDDNFVIILDNCSNSEESTLLKLNHLSGRNPIFFNGCISDFDLLSKITSLYSIDLVIHAVSPTSYMKSEFNPKFCQETFIKPTETFFTNLKMMGLKRYIYFSSNLKTIVYSEYKRRIEKFLEQLNFDNSLNVNIITHAYPFSSNMDGLLENKLTERLDWVQKSDFQYITIENLIKFYYQIYDEPGFNIFMV